MTCAQGLMRSPILAQAATAVAAVALAFGTLSSPALAAPPDRQRIDSTAAAASSSDCVGSVCTFTSAYVATTNDATQACVDIVTLDAADPSKPPSVETGCAPVSAGSFSFDARSLSAATLAPTTITLQVLICDQSGCVPSGATRSVTVSGTFTGIGDVATFRANSKSSFGNCTMYFVGKGSSRQALAVVTIDGAQAASVGFLSISAQKIKVICH